MNKVSTLITAAALVAAPLAFAAPATAGADKVDICHATGNGKYVLQSPDKSGVVAGHAGASHQGGADIIPAFSWVDQDRVRQYFPGQNLDKLPLLANGCVTPAEELPAAPVPPVYVPGSCARPELPYGQVVVPADKGAGVAGASDPRLNADNTVWSVSYALAQSTDELVYSWPAGFDGSYTFDIVPLTADPNYVIDSKTGVGACELPETGAEDLLLPAGVAAALLAAGGAAMVAGKRRPADRRRGRRAARV